MVVGNENYEWEILEQVRLYLSTHSFNQLFIKTYPKTRFNLTMFWRSQKKILWWNHYLSNLTRIDYTVFASKLSEFVSNVF